MIPTKKTTQDSGTESFIDSRDKLHATASWFTDSGTVRVASLEIYNEKEAYDAAKVLLAKIKKEHGMTPILMPEARMKDRQAEQRLVDEGLIRVVQEKIGISW